jgi:4-amino-4-deoxy-L-arabinose transferase-like glycosyltransferase
MTQQMMPVPTKVDIVSDSGTNRLLVLLFLAALVLVAKAPVLSTPYYWDEVGWSRGAYWLSEVSLLRAIPGLYPPETFSGRPPALHLTLAALFKIFGQSVTLAHVLIVGFAVLGVCSTYLLGQYLDDARSGFLAALILFLSPVYFAQSAMFLSDLPVASMGVLAVYLALREKYLLYLLSASYLVFIKETAVFLIGSLLIYLFLTTLDKNQRLARILKHGVPLVEIGLFYIAQTLLTGRSSGAYDHSSLFNLDPRYVFHQALMITKWLFFSQGRIVFTVLILLGLILNSGMRRSKEVLLFGLLLVFSSYSFAFLYPYYLPRYSIAALPYFYLLGSRCLIELIKVPAWQTPVAAGLLLWTVWSLKTQPFVGNAEFNTRYLDVVDIHKQMANFIASEFPHARILTAWPHHFQLRERRLGYVSKELTVSVFDKASLQASPELHEPDLASADLVLVSPVPKSPAMEILREHAVKQEWRLIKRFEKPPVVTELYGRKDSRDGRTSR